MAGASRDVQATLAGLEEGRRALRARFDVRMRATPSLSDRTPLGSGPPNRHGMPRLPPGQGEQDELPVLDLGDQPETPLDRWTLAIDGAVEAPVTLSWADLLALPQVELAADFHCVTGWSMLDLTWRGVPLDALLGLARPAADATHLLVHGRDGYVTNLPLEEALKADVLVAHGLGGGPLPREHGGPARLVVPQLYGWKSAKWVSRLELMTHDRRGYWEIRGYSNTGYPWRDDREW
ncbi:sulfite oxidase-like oxidoreductase [Anaeromyxobacter diazotrophicus]|uniref:sulfite oxidase-like oxidoreductase n=1 Tax=Anaeromyxobacter diazotrophicus TaxID=2590199 RepID=UPI001592A8AA|nr:sulfite oxidase-like oxidoreductase [Anaeromyxobacter diazotrophicus]